MAWSLAVGAFALAVASLPFGAPDVQSVSQAVSGYRHWTKVNPDRVRMDELVAALCRPVTREGASMDKTSPHRKFITVWVNTEGRGAMQAKRPVFPVGSIIVKEKFGSPKGGQPELLTVMRKRERGYDPANGDWEYAVIEPRTLRDDTRSVKHCQGCHQQMRSSDYVFRSYLPDRSRSEYWKLPGSSKGGRP